MYEDPIKNSQLDKSIIESVGKGVETTGNEYLDSKKKRNPNEYGAQLDIISKGSDSVKDRLKIALGTEITDSEGRLTPEAEETLKKWLENGEATDLRSALVFNREHLVGNEEIHNLNIRRIIADKENIGIFYRQPEKGQRDSMLYPIVFIDSTGSLNSDLIDPYKIDEYKEIMYQKYNTPGDYEDFYVEVLMPDLVKMGFKPLREAADYSKLVEYMQSAIADKNREQEALAKYREKSEFPF
jgi:hypothetical protein